MRPGRPPTSRTVSPSHRAADFRAPPTLEALRIRISPDREPPEPARHRGEEWIYVVAGRLRLEFDRQVHLLDAGTTAHFDASRPHRLGAQGGTTEVLVVAADAPNDLRNHPLFSASITDH